MLAVIIHEQRFGAAFALVAAAADAVRIDFAPVAFGLGMDFGIAVNLGRRSLDGLGLGPLGDAQRDDRADHVGLDRLDWIEPVVDRRGRAGKVVDLVDFDEQRQRDVAAHQLEVFLSSKWCT